VDIITVIAFISYGFFMYLLGVRTFRTEVGEKLVQATLAKANIPIGILEKVKDTYYLYEKDSTTFLCQADRIEDIPANLWSNKKISVAAILHPEETGDQVFWCVNGKIRLVQ
jgi:hypothetical protein